jgi:hypothetical protein
MSNNQSISKSTNVSFSGGVSFHAFQKLKIRINCYESMKSCKLLCQELGLWDTSVKHVKENIDETEDIGEFLTV